ncbi:dicarboxylate/amino acid:cation symporter [Odoribacter sp. Z80]|jgi:Na+/H+-dicarboxylate symporter|uniref:dicarboxylate/amino acid:cation symporter n=1 Tax=Odoribacter sp. Z80 TaxID=2304575 RepID=UPI00137958E3|nr:dicarboxylate/amino acid:cation symporter [Odoribacter sp. Z80]NCE72499.1 dicarboxylate/amino acid:cation symporter [Odoribacter sp. Z80]
MKTWKLGLLPKIVIAIGLGIVCGLFFPDWLVRIFITINGLFGNFLGFIIPLLILGLVAPGIADLGKGAGRLLLITAALAYGFTLFSGFFTYLTCDLVYPWLLTAEDNLSAAGNHTLTLEPYFGVEMPPLMGVMTALILAFTLGLGMSVIDGNRLKLVMEDFKEIITKVINSVIIPLLPLYIFGIFLNMTNSGQVAGIMGVFLKIIVVIFVMTVVLLFIQFFIAGTIGKKNPLRLFRNMMPAYMTALGTQSSAATIPVTLEQTIKNGVRPDLAGFVIPLCATIHLSGSTMKIVACALAIMLMSGMEIHFGQFAGFIMMLGIAMVAAPGVPGGAIMAALGLLQSMLGFDETAQGLMIALYIAMDSFGTATNVTGDGAIAVIVDRINAREPA